jgi:hypothetical protein
MLTDGGADDRIMVNATTNNVGGSDRYLTQLSAVPMNVLGYTQEDGHNYSHTLLEGKRYCHEFANEVSGPIKEALNCIEAWFKVESDALIDVTATPGRSILFNDASSISNKNMFSIQATEADRSMRPYKGNASACATADLIVRSSAANETKKSCKAACSIEFPTQCIMASYDNTSSEICKLYNTECSPPSGGAHFKKWSSAAAGPKYLAGACRKGRDRQPLSADDCAKVDLDFIVPENFTMCTVTRYLTVDEAIDDDWFAGLTQSDVNRPETGRILHGFVVYDTSDTEVTDTSVCTSGTCTKENRVAHTFLHGHAEKALLEAYKNCPDCEQGHAGQIIYDGVKASAVEYGPVPTGWTLTCAQAGSSTPHVSVDGRRVSDAKAPEGLTYTQRLGINLDTLDMEKWSQFALGEILVFRGQLNSKELRAVEVALLEKWFIRDQGDTPERPSWLPAGSPFTVAAGMESLFSVEAEFDPRTTMRIPRQTPTGM